MKVSDRSTPAKPATRGLMIALFAGILFVPQGLPAQAFHVLHSFTGGVDGWWPQGGLAIDRAGNVYGTAPFGGSSHNCYTNNLYGCGTVFRLSHAGSGWTFGVLHSFNAMSDGALPQAGLAIGADGSLYGTTQGGGGSGTCNLYGGCGTVYKVRPPAGITCHSVNCPWTETPIYSFTGASDGAEPISKVSLDATGAIYGTLSTYPFNGNGKVFSLTPRAGSWSYQVIYSFGGLPDGQLPSYGGALVFDRSGNLYGVTAVGGASQDGTVFQLTPSQSGWSERVVYSFQGNYDGVQPQAGLVMDAEGNLYGGTMGGGEEQGGMVFELAAATGWSYSPIYSFDPRTCASGQSLPGAYGTMAVDGRGNLYGSTFCGGDAGYGSVFELSPLLGGGWSYRELYSFSGGSDGGYPMGVSVDANGNLFGATEAGGNATCVAGCGVIWEIEQ